MLRLALSLLTIAGVAVVTQLPASAQPPGEVVAGYQRDWRPETPAPGWSYLINTSTNLNITDDLLWNGAWYDADGLPGEPAEGDAAWMHGGPWGVHPGHGRGDGATVDRYIILRYTVPDAGVYAIANSRFDDLGCPSDGVDVRVRLEGLDRHWVTDRAGGFDWPLGQLAAGDTIDVAVGPGQSSVCDATNLDFDIVRLPQVERLTTFRFSDAFGSGTPAGWSFLWNETGPLGDPTGYRLLVANRIGAYNSTGGDERPTDDELAWGLVDRNSVHPGLDQDQGPADDRFVIARFVAPLSGDYRIERSETGTVSSCSNGVELQILIADQNVSTRTLLPGEPSSSFDLDLGRLAAGTPVDVAVGPAGDDACDGIDLDYTIDLMPADPGPVVASFSGDYQPFHPAIGWVYQYAVGLEDFWAKPNLVFNGTHYDVDGVPGPSPGEPFGWGLIAPWGVHPGSADTPSPTNRNWAAMGYRVPSAGFYTIVDSLIADRGCASTGVEYEIWTVGDRRVHWGTHVGTTPASFDRFVGRLNAGDEIYVFIGPGADGSNVCDATDLDFSIARTN